MTAVAIERGSAPAAPLLQPLALRGLQAGAADPIALGREMLLDPNWVTKATVTLADEAGWASWPQPFGWWRQRYARLDRPKSGA